MHTLTQPSREAVLAWLAERGIQTPEPCSVRSLAPSQPPGPTHVLVCWTPPVDADALTGILNAAALQVAPDGVLVLRTEVAASAAARAPVRQVLRRLLADVPEASRDAAVGPVVLQLVDACPDSAWGRWLGSELRALARLPDGAASRWLRGPRHPIDLPVLAAEARAHDLVLLDTAREAEDLSLPPIRTSVLRPHPR